MVHPRNPAKYIQVVLYILRSLKAWVCGRLLAGISGSNLARSMDVCLLSVVCCQLQVSTDCGGSVCDRDASTMGRPWPTWGCCAIIVFPYTDKFSTGELRGNVTSQPVPKMSCSISDLALNLFWVWQACHKTNFLARGEQTMTRGVELGFEKPTYPRDHIQLLFITGCSLDEDSGFESRRRLTCIFTAWARSAQEQSSLLPH
jgi:hypothetical protein